MQLAFSTNAYTRFSLSEALRGIKRAGFSAVEILADVPHAYPAALDAVAISRIAAEVSSLGLAVSNINVNCSFGYWKDAPPEAYFEPSLISPNPRHRADRIALIRRAMDLAVAVGSRNISVTSGRMLGGMPPEKAAGQFAESIKPVLDDAERLKLDIGIECEPGLFLEYTAELADWISRLNHPRFGANLDIGHSHVMGEDVAEAVHNLKGRIWNLHVEDLPGRKHYHMIPGEGTFPWGTLKDALAAVKYDRYLTVELYTHTADPQGAAEASYRFLAELVE